MVWSRGAIGDGGTTKETDGDASELSRDSRCRRLLRAGRGCATPPDVWWDVDDPMPAMWAAAPLLLWVFRTGLSSARIIASLSATRSSDAACGVSRSSLSGDDDDRRRTTLPRRDGVRRLSLGALSSNLNPLSPPSPEVLLVDGCCLAALVSVRI